MGTNENTDLASSLTAPQQVESSHPDFPWEKMAEVATDEFCPPEVHSIDQKPVTCYACLAIQGTRWALQMRDVLAERDARIAAFQIEIEEAKSGAYEAAAKLASNFTVRAGAKIHPDIPWEQMNESAQIAAHTTAQQIAMEIRELKGTAESCA